MTLATSRNLTILGIATILGALSLAATAVFDGDPTTNINWEATVTAIVTGVGMILAKGAQSTGGTVAETGEAKGRVSGFALAPLMFVLALVIGCFIAFAAPRVARADDSGPLAIQLTPDLSLHLNVSVVAGGYDVTNKAWLAQGQIGGLYALTSARLLDAGVIAGGALTFDSSSRPVGEINAGLVSPKLRVTPTLSLHAAALYGRRFGPGAANLIRLVPTLEF